MNYNLHHLSADNSRGMTLRIRNSGFTLIEIMMVIMTIGMLTAIAVPSYNKVRKTIREKQTRQDLLLLQGAIDKLAWDTGRWPGVSYSKAPLRTYYTGSGAWPTHVMDLTTREAGLCSTDGSFGTNWKGPYIGSQKIPRKDAWGSTYWFDPHHYKWKDAGNHCYAAVISSGPDRISYNDDDLYETMQTYY